MNIVRDIALVVGGALAALSLQPSITMGSSDALAPIADRLVAIAEVIKVDGQKNVTISSPNNLSLLADTNLLVQSKDILSLLGSRAEFRGTKIAQVGAGKVADIVKIDGLGNTTIRSHAKISLSASQITVQSKTKLSLTGVMSELTGSAMAQLRGGITRIGKGTMPAVTIRNQVICPAPGRGPCTITPMSGTVLIGP